MDCEALWEFYLELENRGQLNWGPEIPLSEWDGVSSGGWRVVALDLSDSGLSGPISSSLVRLGFLDYLELSHNELTGPIPAELPSLWRLDLSYNQLNGPIPPGLDAVNLDLSHNELTGPIPVELILVDGYNINLSHNKLNGPIPVEFGSSKFKNIWLNDNQLSGRIPPELGNLSLFHNPERMDGILNLARNNLTGPIPSELGSIEYTTHLNLSGNLLTGRIPPELDQLRWLRDLDLSHNQLSGDIPLTLGNLADLRTLRLNNNRLTRQIPSTLGNPLYLKEINLSNNQLSGAIPSELGNLMYRHECLRIYQAYCFPPTGLRFLSLSHNELTGAIPNRLALTSLVHLDLSHNQLTGLIPHELGSLSRLEYVDLGHNTLQGEIPAELGLVTEQELCGDPEDWHFEAPEGQRSCDRVSVPGIRYLSLSHNQLSGSIPPELGGLTNLHTLALQHNHLSWSIPEQLSSLTHLESLDLGHNYLLNPIPEWLGALPNLSYLDLRANLFVDPWPADLVSPRPGLIAHLPPPPERVPIDGPSFAPVGTPVDFSLNRAGEEIAASLWSVEHIGATLESVMGATDDFRLPTLSGPFTVSAIAIDTDGNTFVGSKRITGLDDVAGSDSLDEILWMAEEGITAGCRINSFCPDRLLTRGEMAAFLSRALDLPPGDVDNYHDHYHDDNGSPFEAAINRLAEAGIAHECEPARFCPDQLLTRAQLAGLMARFLILGGLPDGDYFDDDNGSVFEYEINRFAETGLLNGCATRRFCPDGTFTREQMANLLFRARHLIEEARHRLN